MPARLSFHKLLILLALLGMEVQALAQEGEQTIDPYQEDDDQDAEPALDESREQLPAYPVMPGPSFAKKLPPPVRSGLMAGAAVGFGSLAAGNDSNGTLNYTLSFGGYFTPSLALLIDLWGGRATDDDFRIDNAKQGLSALYWLTDSLWTKASLGAASYATYVDDFKLARFQGAALGAGLGWVFYSRGSIHVDARLSLTIESYKDARDIVTSTALQVGLHYF